MRTFKKKLAAALSVDGFQSWESLYDKISSKLTFEMRWPDGRVETLPTSRWRVTGRCWRA